MRDLRSQGLRTRYSLGLLTAAAVVAADQLTKLWAEQALADGDVAIIPGLLRLHLIENTGAAFGLLPQGGRLLGLAAVVAVGVVSWALSTSTRRYDAVALGLIMGGAIGNLVDRLWRGPGILDGAVIDWIDLSFWPTFNLADSGITVGAVLLVLASLRRP